ncbi:MAG: hypothetical protein OEZ10_11710 [Gammaproteobacteria bacterium]|nr:hypothetical protein [Gammaproteobacteria bacterium]
MSEKKFERGTALSIFKSDRMEDFVALGISLAIVAIVVLSIPK